MYSAIPYNPGYQFTEDVDTDPDRDRLRAIRLGKHTLQDYAQDYELFHYGLFFTHGHLLADPLADVEHRLKKSLGLLLLTSDRPFVLGTDPHYDRLLFACPKENYPEVRLHLANVAGADRKIRRYWSAVLQRFAIPDTVLLAKQIIVESIPTVEIDFYSVSATESLWAADLVYIAGVPQAVVLQYPPEESTKQLAAAVFADDSNPLASVDPFYRPDFVPYEDRLQALQQEEAQDPGSGRAQDRRKAKKAKNAPRRESGKAKNR